ncbi:MAG TPA: hypothetical protein VMV01_07745, partial [Planctomycetota bacterium]|nr:hypothetical protein [Planctomycetota bacterium]
LVWAQPQSGRLAPLVLPGAVPPIDRLASRGSGVVVGLGDPSGAVHVIDPLAPALVTLPGVTAQPGAPFVVLP